MDCIPRHEYEGHSSLLLPCGSMGLNSGHHAWQQALLFAEPSQQPSLFVFFLKNIHLLIFMCMGVCLLVCMCATYIPGVLGNQKRVLDAMKLELQTVSICYVDAGN